MDALGEVDRLRWAIAPLVDDWMAVSLALMEEERRGQEAVRECERRYYGAMSVSVDAPVLATVPTQ